MQMPAGEITLRVSVARQVLEVLDVGGAVLRSYPVSTSRFGLGTEPGSFRTPLGRFHVAEKFGAGAALGTVFRNRVPTAEDGSAAADEDLVLTRIFWLAGDEEQNANTHDRYIYIHGTNHEADIGQPASHGCVRMTSADVSELYDFTPPGTTVVIAET